MAFGPYLWNDRSLQRVTLKTSTIFIAKGEQTRVYHSVAEIPYDLRQQLEECTNGFNSATILIADRRGREEIRRALNGMPSILRKRLSSSLNSDATNSDTTSSDATELERPAASLEVPSLSAPEANPDILSSVRTFLRHRWILVAIPFAGLLAWAVEHFR